MTLQRKARKAFTITALHPDDKFHSYQLTCNVDECKKSLGVWDYRFNALNKGYAHAHLAHHIPSERGRMAATQRMFQEIGQ